MAPPSCRAPGCVPLVRHTGRQQAGPRASPGLPLSTAAGGARAPTAPPQARRGWQTRVRQVAYLFQGLQRQYSGWGCTGGRRSIEESAETFISAPGPGGEWPGPGADSSARAGPPPEPPALAAGLVSPPDSTRRAVPGLCSPSLPPAPTRRALARTEGRMERQ